MSGHSRWSTIKRSKEKSDSQKAKIFTKLGREIAVAAKEGGADPISNNRLKLAITKAKQANMPTDKINNILKKGSNDNTIYFENTYEGYGIGGVAVIVKCLTDNKNRTAGDVRFSFDKFGGSLGSSGCVSYMFENKGVITIEKGDNFNEEDVTDIAIENDALDFEDDEEVFLIYTSQNQYQPIVDILTNKKYSIISSQNEMIPNNYATLSDEQLIQFENMLEKFDDNDDIQDYYHNYKQ